MFLGAGWTLVRAQAALGEGLGKVRQGFLSNLSTAYMYACAGSFLRVSKMRPVRRPEGLFVSQLIKTTTRADPRKYVLLQPPACVSRVPLRCRKGF